VKKFSVVMMEDAENDLVDIYQYVSLNDTTEKAERLLDNIEKVILQLETLPSRGNYPPELERVGIHDYREVFFKPYRIIYQISGAEVFVHCVLDGRRDMQSLLQQKLLRPW
jgi:toxin ParE1/3/4